MLQDLEVSKRIYSVFNPDEALLAGAPVYVDCQKVRGDGDILVGLGRHILYSERNTCQIYAGHRGGGKTTELRRLEQVLNSKGCFVIYFAAEEGDIDPEDAQYTDILLACTRHILEALKNSASPAPLLNWLKDRWEDLKNLALTEVSLEKLNIEAQISQFAKLTANLRTEPSQRQKIRERVNPYTITLLEALNQFIRDAKKHLPSGYSQLVVIADSLDRIVPVIQEDGRSNHEHIFIDRSKQLKALDCHLIYTVPISMLYSNRATDLRDIYGADTQVLPMIMVRSPNNQVYQPGINKVKEVIAKRIRQSDPNLSLEKFFEQHEALEQLCLMSGGHIRNLILLVKESIKYTNTLPLSTEAVLRSISEARNTYRNTIYDTQWQPLAKVYLSKEIVNDELHRNLLFNRCILEYRYLDEGEIKCWYDIHPLIKGIKEFQKIFSQIQT